MLTALIALAGTAWSYYRFRRWRKRRRAEVLAETATWKPLREYIDGADHPTPESRWANPRHDRGP